jgi:hypothetical protein
MFSPFQEVPDMYNKIPPVEEIEVNKSKKVFLSVSEETTKLKEEHARYLKAQYELRKIADRRCEKRTNEIIENLPRIIARSRQNNPGHQWVLIPPDNLYETNSSYNIEIIVKNLTNEGFIAKLSPNLNDSGRYIYIRDIDVPDVPLSRCCIL